MTWDEIYNLADGKGYGDFELERKDNARYDVVCFVEDNFGFNLENEIDNGVIESVEEWIDYYVDKLVNEEEKQNIIEAALESLHKWRGTNNMIVY